jgi:Tol biopolymer transport system component
MNKLMESVLADWLHEGSEGGPPDGLERALAATRRVGQRPGWTLPERWIPMQLTMARTSSRRPILALVSLAMLIVALTATALLVGSRPRQALPPFRNGAVVFEQDGDLFIADQAGGTPRPLVVGPAEDSNPVFSRQGDRIAFVRDAPGGRQVMVVNPDGTGATVLVSALDSLDLRLDWASDGSAILASGNGTYGPSADGERDADGELITVMGVGRQSRRLYLIESDGSGSRRLDGGPNVPAGPGSWRPDGRLIAFLGWPEGLPVVVFIAGADGTNVRRLPLDPATRLGGLEWSPDGTQLRYTFDLDGKTHITVADIDASGALTGSHQIPIEAGWILESLTWSPDGRHLALLVAAGSNLHVEVAEPDGSGSRIVGPALPNLVDTELGWSPDGRALVISQPRQDDVDPAIGHYAERAWLLDVATGELTETQTPIDAWQRLAP